MSICLKNNDWLNEEIQFFLKMFLITMDGLSHNQFQELHMNDLPDVEDLPTLNILIYGLNIEDRKITEVFRTLSAKKHGNTG